MKKILWNKVKKVMACVMVMALIFTAGLGMGNKPEISVCGEAADNIWVRN